MRQVLGSTIGGLETAEMTNQVNESLANLIATIESVAAGEVTDVEDDHDYDQHKVITAEMLEGTVLHLSNGQSINVVHMSGHLEDDINVVQVETTDFNDHVSSVEEICAIDIDEEEQQHILSETGAHVVVNTEREVKVKAKKIVKHKLHSGIGIKSSEAFPNVPFSFPGQTFDTKCQKLILNVWDFFRRLKKNPDILDEIRTPQERAAAALHISAATIGKIGKNFKRTGRLETPGKKRNRAKPVVDSVNAEHEQVIHSIIKEYKDNRVTPTLPLILNECRERINFQGGNTSFRRILQRMGYKGIAAKINAHIMQTKLKSAPKATTSMTSVATPNNNQRFPEIVKPISLEDGYVSIPINTPTISQTNNVSFRAAAIPPSNSFMPVTNKMEPSLITSKLTTNQVVANLVSNNLIQLGTTSQGEPISISQQTAAAIASATSRIGEGPQTIHVLQPDNTIQQIQIVYANIT